MKNAIILHGRQGHKEYYDPNFPSASNSHWLPWLQRQLLILDIPAATPEMPRCYKPDWKIWCREFERYDITPDTLIVAHSAGAGFFVRWLSEHKEVCVGKVVLVAPWLDPSKLRTTDFFDFHIDARLDNRTKGLIIFNSDNDESKVQQSVEILRREIASITYREFAKCGHFCGEGSRWEKFPELLAEIVAN